MESTQSPVKFRHVGSFSLLLLLSVFQPKPIWPEFSVPFVPTVLLLLGLILIYKVWLTIGIKGVWQKYLTAFTVLLAGIATWAARDT